MEATDKVIQTLKSAGKPMKAGEIAEASGIDKKDVEKAIKKLVADSKLHSPMRCFYDIKKYSKPREIGVFYFNRF